MFDMIGFLIIFRTNLNSLQFLTLTFYKIQASIDHYILIVRTIFCLSFIFPWNFQTLDFVKANFLGEFR